ncbi:MAG TPA: DMT family transporter [Calditerricola sp.]
MGALLTTLLMLLAGVGLSMQAAINGTLGKKIGALEGALVNFFVGTLILLLTVLFAGHGQLGEVLRVPKWQLLGGLIGAMYVAAMVFAVPRIGVGVAVMAVIVGQLAMSMAIDHFGLFGLRRIPVDGYRLAGALLLAVALFLIYRGSGR